MALEYGSAIPSLQTFSSKVEIAGIYGLDPSTINDLQLLQAVSEVYHISDNPKDYVLVSVPIVVADLPNRNLFSLNYDQLLSKTERDEIVWSTFLHSPIFHEHNHNDPTQALGFIVDVSFVDEGPFNSTVYALLAWDKTKNPSLTPTVLSGKSSWSMGCFVDSYICSLCGQEYQVEDGQDPHTVHRHHHMQGLIENDILIYRAGKGIEFFEISLVGTPAYHKANTIDVNQGG